jgi:hypothetical protein
MSQTDAAGELAKLLQGVVNQALATMSVAWPAKVLAFDPDNGIASIQPLLKLNGVVPAQVQLVPVLGQRVRTGDGQTLTFYPDLRAGDTVYAVCADRQLGSASSGQMVVPGSGRNHSKMDAVIVGVFTCSLQK